MQLKVDAYPTVAKSRFIVFLFNYFVKMSAARLKEWLEKQVSAASPGSHLPTQGQLSEQFGVSRVTVAAALRPLVRNGSLLPIRGKGTFVAPLHPVALPALAPSSQESFFRLAETLRALITTGELRAGDPFPSVKSLCGRFRVTQMTVGRALRQLEADGLAQKTGRSWFAAGSGLMDSQGRSRDVVFFYPEPTLLAHHLERPDTGRMFFRLEGDLQLAGVRLSHNLIADLPHRARQWRREGLWPPGILVLAREEEHEAIAPRLRRLLTYAAAQKPRILFFCPRLKKMFRHFRYMTHGSSHTSQGREIARFALRRGVREVHLFVIQAGSSSNFRDAIRLFPEILHLCPDVQVHYHVRVVDAGLSPENLVKNISVKGSSPEEFLTRTLSKYTPIAPSLFMNKVHVSESVDALPQPRHKQLWVLFDQERALGALEICRRRGMVPGRDLSLITMEDRPANYHLGLSVCSTDWDAMGSRLARFFLGTAEPERGGQGYLRIPSRILHRTTTH